jgi:protein O-mannosyl-transferase
MKRKQARRAQTTNRTYFGAAVWIAAGIFLVAIALYFHTRNYGFVHDDTTLILQNQQVKRLAWSEILGRGGYRPVRTMTYAVNYAVGGENPYGYHLFNILLHGLNAALLFLLLLRWTRSNIVAGGAALLFVVHPVQTAAVAYISGRKDLLAAFFVLLGLYLYTVFRESRSKPAGAGAFVAFVLGVLSKEVAIVFPALLLLVDTCILRERTVGGKEQESSPPTSFFHGVWKAVKAAPVLYAMSAALAALAIFYAIHLTQASRMLGFWGGTFATNLGTSFKLFVHYIKLSLFPYPLIADYTGKVFPVSAGFREPATLLALLYFCLYVGFALWFYTRNRRLTFVMFWMLATLLPILQLIPFHELAADHLLYLPLVGLALIFGEGLNFANRLGGVRLWGWSAAAVIVLVSCLMTVGRSQEWKDDRTLWEATYRRAPGSYRANSNLGVIYQSSGDLQRAVEFTRRSLELEPSQGISWSNLGGIYLTMARNKRADYRESMGLLREAIEVLERSVELEPRNPWNHSNLGDAYKFQGLLYEDQGEVEKAFEVRVKAVGSFQRAIEIGSDNDAFPLIFFKRAMVFVDGGYEDEAVRLLREAIARFPRYPEIYVWLGAYYFNQGKYGEALPYLEPAAELAPRMETFGMLARCFEETGHHVKSIEIYSKALRMFPNSVEVHYNLGVLHHRVGDLDKAVYHLRRALQLDPNGKLVPNIHSMLKAIRGHVS